MRYSVRRSCGRHDASDGVSGQACGAHRGLPQSLCHRFRHLRGQFVGPAGWSVSSWASCSACRQQSSRRRGRLRSRRHRRWRHRWTRCPARFSLGKRPNQRLQLPNRVVLRFQASLELLSPVLVPYGFVLSGRRSRSRQRRTLCPWRLARANRSLEFSVRHALGEVRYRVDAATLLHEDFARAGVGRGQARYPGFSDDPLDGFRDLATDLVRFGSASSPAPPRSLRALVPRKPSVPGRRAGLPRSSLAITLLGWAWAHLRTRPARNAAP